MTITPPADKLAKGREDDALTGCWNWTGRTDDFGYGLINTKRDNGKWIPDRTHRIAWRCANGEIPDDLCVLHSCDNPRCINPRHLFLGTRPDNNADMFSKGRGRPGVTRGAQHGMARLTAEQIAEIRARYRDAPTGKTGTRKASGEVARIASDYGIRSSYVTEIVAGKFWKEPAADVKRAAAMFAPEGREIAP